MTIDTTILIDLFYLDFLKPLEFPKVRELKHDIARYKDDIWLALFSDKIKDMDWGRFTFDYSMATDGISTSLRYHCN